MKPRAAIVLGTVLSLLGNTLFCGVVWLAYVARSADREGGNGTLAVSPLDDARWNGASAYTSLDSDEDEDEDDTAEKAWRSLGGTPLTKLRAASRGIEAAQANPL